MRPLSAIDGGWLWAVRLGSIAAWLGGLSWTVKGLSILVVAKQPPVVFELGAPLFAVALLGLFAALHGDDRRAVIGGVAAGLAVLLVVIAAIARAIDPTLAPEGEAFTPLSVVLLATAVCLVAALVLLGLASRRSRRLRWSALPFWMGILVVPGLLLGGALAEVNERLLEIPLVLFALAWMPLGYSMWHSITQHGDREAHHPRAKRTQAETSRLKAPGIGTPSS